MANKSLIIGCGKQAEKHILGIHAVDPEREILVTDADPTAQKRLADLFKGPDGPSVVIAENVEIGIIDPSVDTVFICTPTASHASLAELSANAGKSFLCEKPFSDDLDATERLVENLDNNRIVGAVGYIYRAASVFREGLALIAGEDPILKNLNNAFLRIGGRGSHAPWKHQRATKGGAINEMLIHMLDLAQWYFGPATNVMLLDSALRQPERLINGGSVVCDAEDFVLVKYETSRTQAPITILADMNSPGFIQYLDVQATEGAFVGSILGSFDSHVFLSKAARGRSAGKTSFEFPAENLFIKQTDEFFRAVRGEQVANLCTVEQDLTNMRTVSRIRAEMAS